MSAQCDIARLALRKHELMDELAAVRRNFKSQCKDVELPFAAEIDGQIVTVKKTAGYDGEMPQTSIVPLHGKCDL